MPIPATRKMVLKACDACRRRKIKCDGLQPCLGCRSANLACTFDAPRGQGGNRGVRATVLNDLRAKSHNRNATHEELSSSNLLPVVPTPQGSGTAPTTFHLLDECMDAWATYIYPVVPLLDASVVRLHADQASISPTSYRFVKAFLAYVCNFGRITDVDNESPGRSALGSGKYWLESAMSAQSSGVVAQPTPLLVYISFFLYGAWAGQGDYQQAWYYLREATTFFTMLRPKFEDWYDEKAQRCLFWVLVVSER
jgi:SP family general alpha glucoside:H+ symporter-like MFS transporter